MMRSTPQKSAPGGRAPPGFLKVRQKLFRFCRFIVVSVPFKPRYERALVIEMLSTESDVLLSLL